MARRTTLQDIATKLGYSKNTISLALRNDPQIPEATRARIKKTAEAMDYQANPIVSHLMAQLRASQTPGFQAKLALVNAHQDPRAFHNHPTIPSYVSGCRRRARQLGYEFDEFWLHDPKLSSRSWTRILKTRGIRGLVLVGLMDRSKLPRRFQTVWPSLACAATGVRTSGPTLPYSCADHHDLVVQACQRALKLGYKRPALVIDDVIDRLVERRFSAGYLIGQQAFAPPSRLPPLFTTAKYKIGDFQRWLEQARPDLIFILYNSVLRWLEKLGYRIPKDIGVIQLEWRDTHPHIAGMRQRNDIAGEAAVDMVVNQLHNGETGVPASPRSILIGATWTDGPSVREQKRRAQPRCAIRTSTLKS